MKIDVDAAVAALQKRGRKRNRDGLARYGIVAQNPLGVSVADIRALAKRIGHDHSLALALWRTNIYEARLLAAFVAESEKVTPALMDRWAGDFDNWAICDTLCFHLFWKATSSRRGPSARSPSDELGGASPVWAKVEQWSSDRREFVQRAAFALLASLALHDKTAPDQPFHKSLSLIERVALSPVRHRADRNFVKKAVSWALRAIGRRNRALHSAAVRVARRLSTSPRASARWIGKDALKELTSPAVQRRLRRTSDVGYGTSDR